jgi:hypothetical protein
MENLHPSSRFSQNVSSKRIIVLEEKILFLEEKIKDLRSSIYRLFQLLQPHLHSVVEGM